MFKKILSIFKASPPKKGPFQVGDRVQANFGNIGKIKSLSKNGMFVEVEFPEAPCTVVFRVDGKLFGWAKKPSLKKL